MEERFAIKEGEPQPIKKSTTQKEEISVKNSELEAKQKELDVLKKHKKK